MCGGKDSHSLSVEELASEYLDRLRAGEHPTVEEYVARYPDLAGEIEDIFPTMAALEGVKEHRERQVMASDIGERVDRLGDFVLRERIGQGGMGVVYRAVQEPLEREAAVKVMSGFLAGDARASKRFLREASLAARLHHPNIVPIYGFGEESGHAFYAMQYVRGVGLDRLIEGLLIKRAQGGPVGGAKGETPIADLTRELLRADSPGGPALSMKTMSLPGEAVSLDDDPSDPAAPLQGATRFAHGSPNAGAGAFPGRGFFEEVLDLMVQGAAALAYAHSQGVLHRDIKPANLLVDSKGVLWMADFGMAKALDSATITAGDSVTGTLRYMAPETFNGQGGERSDIYSLGATMYELLTQRPVFPEGRPGRLIQAIMSGGYEPMRRANPAIPPVLETVVGAAMATDPEDRYTDAGEFLRALELARDHLDSGPDAFLAQDGRRGFSRTFAWASSLLALLLLILLAVVFRDELPFVGEEVPAQTQAEIQSAQPPAAAVAPGDARSQPQPAFHAPVRQPGYPPPRNPYDLQGLGPGANGQPPAPPAGQRPPFDPLGLGPGGNGQPPQSVPPRPPSQPADQPSQ